MEAEEQRTSKFAGSRLSWWALQFCRKVPQLKTHRTDQKMTSGVCTFKARWWPNQRCAPRTQYACVCRKAQPCCLACIKSCTSIRQIFYVLIRLTALQTLQSGHAKPRWELPQSTCHDHSNLNAATTLIAFRRLVSLRCLHAVAGVTDRSMR